MLSCRSRIVPRDEIRGKRVRGGGGGGWGERERVVGGGGQRETDAETE